jgi:hypothetical protein
MSDPNATARPASPLTVTFDPSGGYTIDGSSSVRAYAELVTLHALEFEVRTGMKMTRGRSAYATVKARYGFKGNKRNVLAQLHADMVSRGFNLPALSA